MTTPLGALTYKTSLRGASYEALRVALETGVPALASRVAVDPMPNHLCRYPALGIFTATGPWRPEQPVERWAAAANAIALDCGIFDTAVLLRMAWSTREQRAELEAAILNLFLASETTGVLVLPVDLPTTIGRAYATFRLDDTLWDDDSAWIPADLRHQSTLSLSGEIPAVAFKTGVEPLGIVLGIGDDVDDEWTSDGVEHFVVNADGTLTPGAPNGL